VKSIKIIWALWYATYLSRATHQPAYNNGHVRLP